MNDRIEYYVSTPCRGITCAELAEEIATDSFSFLPPVGESPVLSLGTMTRENSDKFLPPVGESPVLRLGQ